MATDHNTIKLLDHEHMQAKIDQANSNRASQIDCQFQVLEDDLEQVPVDLEHMEARKRLHKTARKSC